MSDEIVQTAFSYFRLLSENKTSEAIDVLDDRGTYWSAHQNAVIRMQDFKPKVVRSWEAMPREFILQLVADVSGSQVVMELQSLGVRPGGEPYDNYHCFVADVLDGKIMNLREYSDTRQVDSLPPEMQKQHVH